MHNSSSEANHQSGMRLKTRTNKTQPMQLIRRPNKVQIYGNILTITMMRCVFVFLMSGSVFAGTDMQDSLPQQKSNTGSFLDRLGELKNKAVLATGAIRKHGVPRGVARGARPEIIIKGEVIYFNGTSVRIGESLASWGKVLSSGKRCSTGDGITICVWDSWGLEIGTDDKKSLAYSS